MPVITQVEKNHRKYWVLPYCKIKLRDDIIEECQGSYPATLNITLLTQMWLTVMLLQAKK